MDIRTKECPDENALAALLEGHLNETQLRSFHEHLSQCVLCQSLCGVLANSQRPSAGESTSHYRLEHPVGEGGMGIVYRARDEDLQRPVALKLLGRRMVLQDQLAELGRQRTRSDELGPASATLEARFLREALITARLQHPSIVPVYQAGRWSTGEVFYTMRLISGSSLHDWFEQAATLDQRLALLPHVLAAADAVAYAHSERVIHRDLKPSNIMIGPFGETLIIDWGLAKVLDEKESSPLSASPEPLSTTLTRAGHVLGTPAYMAPEQGRGEPVDERADVYALGAILHHLFHGAPPSQTGTHARTLVRSTPLFAVDPPEHNVSAPPDLIAIVDKAIAAEKDQRYPTAKELADDLRRFEAGQLVAAYTYSTSLLLRRWLRRHRTPVAIVVALLLAATIGGLAALQRIVAARVSAERERTAAIAGRDELLLTQAVSQLAQDPAATIAWLKRYPKTGREQSRMHDIALEAQALGVPRHVFRTPTGLNIAAFSPNGKWFAGKCAGNSLCVWDLATGTQLARSADQRFVWRIKFSPDNEKLVLMHQPLMPMPDADVLVWHWRSGHMQSLKGAAHPCRMATWLADGRLETLGEDGSVHIWDVTSEKSVVLRIPCKSKLETYDFSPDGKLVSYKDHFAVGVMNLESGQARRLLAGDGISDQWFSPDGKLLAVGGKDVIHIWEAETGKYRQQLPGSYGEVLAVAFRNNRELLVGTDRNTCFLWRLGATSPLTVSALQGAGQAVAISPDGRLFAAAGSDGTGRIWDSKNEIRRELRGFTHNQIWHFTFSPDGMYLAACGMDGVVRIWNVAGADGRAIVQDLATMVSKPSFSANGRFLAFPVGRAFGDGAVYVQDLATGETRHFREYGGFGVLISPDGKWIATTNWSENTVRLWNAMSGESRTLINHSKELAQVAFTPDSARLLATGDGTIRVWAIPTGKELLALKVSEGAIGALAVSPDGTHFASAGFDGTVHLWNLAGQSERVFGDGREVFRNLVIAADGKWLAASTRRIVRAWSLDGRDLLVESHKGNISPLAVSRTGLLAWASGDGTLRLTDVATGQAKDIAGPSKSIATIAFSPDGALLAVGGQDRIVRVYSTATAELQGYYLGRGPILRLAYSPDGKHIVAAGGDNMTLWSTASLHQLPRDDLGWSRWLEDVTTAVLDRDNGASTPDR
jgi:WD40 repeat protein/serine/threonine protein kinase